MGTHDLYSLPKNQFHAVCKITMYLKKLIQCNVVDENLIPDKYRFKIFLNQGVTTGCILPTGQSVLLHLIQTPLTK